ncbi:hypothetical protein [Ciceribacter selenitireducens]|jgi:hypothetical protein|nr:hypothetical protein [Rhizobium sp.]
MTFLKSIQAFADLPAKINRLDKKITEMAAKPAEANAIPPSSRAQRPIGLVFDELSRGINPFSLLETAGVADATDSIESIAEKFNRFGIVKVKRVYSPEASRELNQQCINFSGLKPLDFSAVYSKKKKWGTGGAPVFKDEVFWPYAANPVIRDVIVTLLGERCFEFGTAVAAHYSARGLHRDFRNFVEDDSSPYSVKNPQRRVIRILHYCGISGGALGYIPFSHNEKMFAEQAKRIGLKHGTAWFDRHREVLTKARVEKNFVDADEIERHICWSYADPGDVIISNSAMLHCGEYLTGPRYFFVSTYAASDEQSLKAARNNIKTFPQMGERYYRYMSEQGFKGSDDVLLPEQAESEHLA